MLGQLQEENKVTANKMAEQVQQVMMKDPKKVKQGKRLAEHNRRKREELKARKERDQQSKENNLTYYGTGAVVVIGLLDVIGYYVYKSKTLVHQPNESPVHQPKETPDKFNMD